MARTPLLVVLFFAAALCGLQAQTPVSAADSLNNHKVILDEQGKIIPWTTPLSKAYSHFLAKRWNFIKTSVPNSPGPAPRSLYPQYYFYCAYRPTEKGLEPDTWMSDIGERIPNWFESARLYYAFSGDSSVMTIVENLINYAIDHGTSAASFAWPDFPYTTTNAGDTIFRGFTSAKRFLPDEIQVDHAGDMGLTYYRLYLFTGKLKYKNAAIKVANTLAAKARVGSATQSVWPYRVVMSSGRVAAEYGANWAGCYDLLDQLSKAKLGKVAAYQSAMKKVKDFVLEFPMKTGFWTDGHTDTDVDSHTYKSNMSASNTKLYMFDHPEFDASWKSNIPKLIKWTEDNFVTRSAPGEQGLQWGAHVVGEQDSFLYKMDYQTARYAAECARWYAVTGDETYKEKAYRSLNWVTYCNDSSGLAFESPVSKGISSWWSDCYGEGPRMFYHAFAAIPEWAPDGEDHILYSAGILQKINYQPQKISYRAVSDSGVEYLRLSFRPGRIILNKKTLAVQKNGETQGYTLKELGGGDYSVIIKRTERGDVTVMYK